MTLTTWETGGSGSVGELLENQYRIGLVRMERLIRERMSLQDTETMMPHDLINAKSVGAAVKEFFGSSQLSQLWIRPTLWRKSLTRGGFRLSGRAG